MSSTFWAIMILASLLIAYCSKYMFVLVLFLDVNPQVTLQVKDEV